MIEHLIKHRDVSKGVTFYSSTSDDLLAVLRERIKFEGLGVRERHGGYFFEDAKLDVSNFFERSFRQNSKNISWTEQSINGRYSSDYGFSEEFSDPLESWVNVIVGVECYLGNLDKPRLYLRSQRDESGNEYWFSFGVLRTSLDDPMLGRIVKGRLANSMDHFVVQRD